MWIFYSYKIKFIKFTTSNILSIESWFKSPEQSSVSVTKVWSKIALIIMTISRIFTILSLLVSPSAVHWLK